MEYVQLGLIAAGELLCVVLFNEVHFQKISSAGVD